MNKLTKFFSITSADWSFGIIACEKHTKAYMNDKNFVVEEETKVKECSISDCEHNPSIHEEIDNDPYRVDKDDYYPPNELLLDWGDDEP